MQTVTDACSLAPYCDTDLIWWRIVFRHLSICGSDEIWPFRLLTGSSTAFTVRSKKHWSQPCTFNLTNKPSAYDPVEPTLSAATGKCQTFDILLICILKSLFFIMSESYRCNENLSLWSCRRTSVYKFSSRCCRHSAVFLAPSDSKSSKWAVPSHSLGSPWCHSNATILNTDLFVCLFLSSNITLL